MSAINAHLKHRNWAEENERFSATIVLQDQISINWCIAILFYAAVHYVDCYFGARGRKAIIHHQRNTLLGGDPLIGDAYSPYRRLQVMSEQARYEMAPFIQADVEKARRLLSKVKAIILPRLD